MFERVKGAFASSEIKSIETQRRELVAELDAYRRKQLLEESAKNFGNRIDEVNTIAFSQIADILSATPNAKVRDEVRDMVRETLVADHERQLRGAGYAVPNFETGETPEQAFDRRMQALGGSTLGLIQE